MEIISDINHQVLPPSVATIGFFDGVHRGHRFLINQVKEVADKDGLYSALVTFPMHPRQVIQTTYHPQLLSSPKENLSYWNDASRLLPPSSFYTKTFAAFGPGIHAVTT